ncbi:hypothetical protein ACF0H5_010724 [Mactra antiquata]
MQVFGHLLTAVLLVCGLYIALSHGSTKKGVSHWAPKFQCNDFEVLNNMTWWYDWKKNLDEFEGTDNCSSTNVIHQYADTYVPMIWSYYPKTVVKLEPNTAYLLGFNEPNHKKQANRTPYQAANYWKKVESHAEGRLLVSPAAAPCGTYCINEDPIEWFDQFFGNCTGCRVDHLATHYYGCNATHTMNYLQELYNRYQKKIWLTEFACGDRVMDPTVQLNYMKDVLPRLEAADFVFRYAWFTARRTETTTFTTSSASLLKPDMSALTPLGQYYNDFQGSSSTAQ